jgi:hypothetical protein
MPCNCGKKRGSVTYEYVAPDGRTTTYSTEVQAKAAKVRAGNTGEVRVVSR